MTKARGDGMRVGAGSDQTAFGADELRLCERLRDLVGEGATACFHDACVIHSRRSELHAATHLVGHCIEGLDSATRAAIGLAATGSRLI